MKQSTPGHKPEAEAVELKSPQAWAAQLGAVGKLRAPLGESFFKDYRHSMARTIHGWSGYEYHEGAPLELSLADYQAALKVAESFPYKPHTPALTKYAPAEYRTAAK